MTSDFDSTEKGRLVVEVADWVRAFQPVNFEFEKDSEPFLELKNDLAKLPIRALRKIERAFDHADDIVTEYLR